MSSALGNIMAISASALTAETKRLETTASNLSNAHQVKGNKEEVFKAKYPVFKTIQQQANDFMGTATGGVRVDKVLESKAEPIIRYEPNHPMADKDGFVYEANINYIDEMANMISASRSYEMNLETFNSAKQLFLRTIQLGK